MSSLIAVAHPDVAPAEQVRAELVEGDAVVQKVLPEPAPYGGRIIQTSLSSADEDRLREAVAAVRAGAAHAA
ncbi:DUF1269 domain-containing protein [Streptacidiphilus melanogenes]|uniref:DUF1269 domain-containing protein n=1 Tax=Streptacidiphilus melanogenes TaxID=411235 RepID=UPI0005AB75D3|nr:DUF1269 domain-containing protein [Streptacidiphilus melanogenes]